MDTQEIRGKLRLFLASYKTTIVGLAVAALNLWANGRSAREIVVSVAVGLLGLVAKDADMTNAVVGTEPKRIPGDAVAKKNGPPEGGPEVVSER